MSYHKLKRMYIRPEPENNIYPTAYRAETWEQIMYTGYCDVRHKYHGRKKRCDALERAPSTNIFSIILKYLA